MNARQRFLETLQFGRPDRIPYQYGWPRESTIKAWWKQGLPAEVTVDNFPDFAGLDHWEFLPLSFKPLPAFEEIVLEETPRHKIWIDELGAKRLDHKDPATPGFVTRAYLDFPVKNRADFEVMKERYQPDTPGRRPANWRSQVAAWNQRDYVLGLPIQSMFWRTRDWVGFEGLCRMLYDDPTLVQDMMEYVADFTIAAAEEILSAVEVDYVLFNEDMAYKTASMISPGMVKEYLTPRYRKLVNFFQAKGIPVMMMDCDGHISQLIPLWLEVNINVVSPLEIAANNDPVAYRKQYGSPLAMFGGIDKRELRFDKARVKKEVMSKVPELLERGGFIPAVDHGVPPDIPIRNYLYMGRLLRALAVGGDIEHCEAPDEMEEKLGPIEEMWTSEKGFPDEE